MYQLYLSNKKNYMTLTTYRNLYKGGNLTAESYKQMQQQNLNIFFDKGSNNIWMEQYLPDENMALPILDYAKKINNKFDKIDKKKMTSDEFEQIITAIMNERYYIRENNLDNLFKIFKKQYGDVINLNYLDNFYSNMFKGSAFKKYFPDDMIKNNPDLINLRKRYEIYMEYVEQPDQIPKKKYFTFVDKPNPCHLVKIMKDEFKRNDDSTRIKYSFVNIKELGRGKAGTASLFSYRDRMYADKMKIAVKLMASDQFSLTNDGKFLPLAITYVVSDKKYGVRSTTLDPNVRYIISNDEIELIDEKYPNYNNHNIFTTNNTIYNKVMLSCPSDNFSNQTTMHMILSHILDEHGIHNYIKQYDAMLCWNTVSDFPSDVGKGYYEQMIDGFRWLYESGMQAIGYDNATVDGLNFMEAADLGDLHSHLFEIQKIYFEKIRNENDLDHIDETSFRKDHGYNNNDDDMSYQMSLKLFLGNMITQILKPLSILQHPKYAFVHGDLKTKNIFVKSQNNSENINIYIYKLADYDKSSINFNGIRFHNEGSKFIQTIKKYWGLSSWIQNKTIPPVNVKQNSADDVKLNTNINSLNAFVYKINPDETLFDQKLNLLFRNNNLKQELAPAEIVSLLYEYIIEHIKNDVNVTSERIIESLNKVEKKYNHELLRNILRNTINNLNKNEQNDEEKKDEEEKKYEEENKENLDAQIQSFIKALIVAKDTDKNIDKYYTLTSIVTKASKLFTGIEQIEMEQLHVRYSPIPFYHTIDLYTLFLSLLQSPMIFAYIKYCYALLKNENNTRNDDIFWNSFRDIWLDEDIYTIIGYYEYLFQTPPNPSDDMSSIGFILDPIKKNPIQLLKKVDDDYWRRIWKHDEWSENMNKITQTMPVKNHQVILSAGNLGTMPNICLTLQCNDFEIKTHRNGVIYYVNKDVILYNTTGVIGRAAGVMSEELKNNMDNIVEKKINTTSSQIIDYIQINKNNKSLLDELFGYGIDVSSIISDLQNKKYGVLRVNKYITETQISNDITDVCRTNTYTGSLGGYYNWDYCMQSYDKIHEILEKMTINKEYYSYYNYKK